MSGGLQEAAQASSPERPEVERRSDRAVPLRRVFAPLRVAALRVARRPARSLLVATGIALATASLFGVLGGSLVVQDRAVRHALSTLAPEDRSLRVDAVALPLSERSREAPAAIRALALLTSRPPVGTVAYRSLRLESYVVALAAVERLGSWVTLHSGRLPRVCRPARCEVLVVGSQHLPRSLTERGIHVVAVGSGSLRTPAVLGSFARLSDATLLLTSDVRGLSSLPALRYAYRTDSWVTPIEAGDLHSWQLQQIFSRETRAQALLERADPALALTTPDDALLEAQREGRIAARRLLLVGGEVAAVLLGFVILAAVGLRGTLGAEWRRLEERGARRFQLWLFLSTEGGAAAVAGVVAGALIGGAAAAVVASRADVRVGALVSHGLLTGTGALALGLTLSVATMLIVITVRAPAGPRAGPVRTGDVVAAGAVATAVVAALRGGAGADTLSTSSGTGTLLLLFPGLAALAGALLAGRILRPALRLAERRTRRAPPAVRLGLLALARAPARTTVAVSFLVVSLGLALLASSYRATLAHGVRDEAAYQVPLDYALTEGQRLVLPLDAAPLARYRALAPGVEAYPVLRRYADVPGAGTAKLSPVVLGLDPAAVASVHNWRPDFGDVAPPELASLLGKGGRVRLAGVDLPRGTTGFALRARAKDLDVDLALAIARPSGEIVTIPLVHTGPGQGLPPGPAVPEQGRVVGLEISVTRAQAKAIVRREIASPVTTVPHGSIRLGPLVALAGSRSLGAITDWHHWLGRSGAKVVPGGPVTVRYSFPGGQPVLIRPRQPTDGKPLPLVVSPDVARSATSDGLVSLEFGTDELTGRVVAVASRFPGTADGGGSFVVTEESRLQTALDAENPGSGWPGEVWLGLGSPSAAHRVDAGLRRPPFSDLDLASRRAVEQDLRSDPLSRGIELTLSLAALLALVLAAAGLWLTVLGDVADERGELYDLEAQGVEPGELRLQLRLRAAVLVALGIAGGLALGLVLSSEVVRLVQVSASGAEPVPPLIRDLGWGTLGLGLAALLVAGAGLVELTARRAFREDTPHPSGELG